MAALILTEWRIEIQNGESESTTRSTATKSALTLRRSLNGKRSFKGTAVLVALVADE